MRANTDRMISMIDSAVAGSAPFLPVRLVVFPEFAHAAPVYPTVAELLEKLAVPIPNEHTDRIAAAGARARHLHPDRLDASRRIERWPGVVFNTTCLIGPEGILYKYRKVNPWIPYEVHASPHDLEGYDEPLFPVADTPIGRIGCAICYDWLFPGGDPAARRQRRRGAGSRVGVHGSLGRDRADELVDAREPLPRAREHRVRGGGQPGREPASLPALLVAGRQPDRRLRRAPARRGLSRTRASGSSSRPSTSPPCVTSARRDVGTTCWRTCAPRHTRCTATGFIPRAASNHRRCPICRMNGIWS